MINKKSEYEKCLQELSGFFAKYQNLSTIAKYSSVVSSLKNNVSAFFFVGFYIVIENELQVGPYMSTILATPRIAYGKGQCGQCYAEKKVQIQADVKLCQNYIACDNETQSEIVLPIFKGEDIIAVLDIDSEQLNRFDEIDVQYLQKIIEYLN